MQPLIVWSAMRDSNPRRRLPYQDLQSCTFDHSVNCALVKLFMIPAFFVLSTLLDENSNIHTIVRSIVGIWNLDDEMIHLLHP
jgi:hypothetical protein